MNIVAVIGNLASPPELRYTPAGRAVCSFRLAVSRPGGEQADFFDVVAWERQAEVCSEYLAVGRRVAVEGRLHHVVWDHDSQRRSRVEVVAHRIQMLGSRTKRAHEHPNVTDETPAEAPSDVSAEVTELPA